MTTPPTDKQLAEDVINAYILTSGGPNESVPTIAALITAHLAPTREALKKAEEQHDKVTAMISRYLVASKGHVADSWMEGFIECGAITYDRSYPTGFIAPVVLSAALTQIRALNPKTT